MLTGNRLRPGAVQFACEIEQHCHGLGRIEVIIHGLSETIGIRISIQIADGLEWLQTAKCRVKTREAGLRFLKRVLTVIERTTVMAVQDKEANDFGSVDLENLTHGEEVAERLRHLLVVDAHKAVVHPVIDEGVTVRAFRLRDFVFVVRKLQVLSAAVNVELRAEQRTGHRRTFDVPARSPVAPGAGPGRFARLGVLPKHEIERIVFGLGNFDALACVQVVERLARKLAVAGKIADRIIDVTVRRQIGELFRLKLANDFLHLLDILRGARLVIRLDHAQRGCIFIHGGNETRRQGIHRFLVLSRALDDLVVDIRNVADVGHLIAGRAQPARHHVEHHHHTGVTEVAVVVDGHAADVHAYLPGHQRLEFLFFATQGVIDLQHAVWRSLVGPRSAPDWRGAGARGGKLRARPLIHIYDTCLN